ncbi:PHP domain-containing protein [Neiella marina]|uniref:PHP domain-containing protein n=1 Tax=Neiella holothuriorum TaxID=2870530 RepID=A0ABS7EHZ2_9GAMM|nr:PHP domain-containing protein [Neiella holothuriorum]MBW8191840.1 PHP domain-containing protein [Neiella holothuriorum]
MKKLARNLLVTLFTFTALIVLTAFALLSSDPVIQPSKGLAPADVRAAKNKVKAIREQLISRHSRVELQLSQQDIDAIMAVASYSIPNAQFGGSVTPYGMAVAGSVRIPLGFKSYLNVSCMLLPDFDASGLQDCKIGSIPLPSGLIQSTAVMGFGWVFGDEAKRTLDQIISGAQFKSGQLMLVADKPTDFREQIKGGIQGLANTAKTIHRQDQIELATIDVYLTTLRTMSNKPSSLAPYVQEVMKTALARTAAGADPAEENTAALWALAIKFGSYRFASLAGYDGKPNVGKRRSAALQGRQDLALHFLYSAILEQLGRAELAFSIGEIKELLDANQGGSGYSFADLAADKAGLKFSEWIAENDKQARRAQDMLAFSSFEETFFPLVHDLPEGFREKEFKAIFGQVGSAKYKALAQKIDVRIDALALYSDGDQVNQRRGYAMPVEAISSGQWLVVDTHTHTKFSDGSHTVAEVANKAASFGCDAIAIADHSDRNLKKVASRAYVDAIRDADLNHPQMSVITALEWNVPPFMGREHATVLFPQSADLLAQISTFRNRYDSYKKRTEEMLSAKPALTFLEDIDVYGTQPVVFYNHPSRKTFYLTEIVHDMESWMAASKLVIGMSGSPGHQKKKGKNNGSYTFKHRTVAGWDPAVARIGGKWDELLQKGFNVWGARANSDFHSTKMDYWPCQFSTTHLYARSNRHNDVIQGLQAGRFWAQHGRFIESLEFSASTTNGQTLQMGETGLSKKRTEAIINVDVQLAAADWQGLVPQLSELELVVVLPHSVRSYPLEFETSPIGSIRVRYPLTITAESTVVRIRGVSKQPDRRDYWFYSNPIRIQGAG